MKRRVGKRMRKICTAAAAAMFLSLAVLASAARADVLVESFWYTMYEVNYDAVVDSPQGGEHFRYGAGMEYPENSDEMIPNGAVIHVFGECRADDGTFWGRAKYGDESGFLPLAHIKKSGAQQEETAAAETTAAQGPAVQDQTEADMVITETAIPAETPAAETNAAAETTAAAEQTLSVWTGILSTLFNYIRSVF